MEMISFRYKRIFLLKVAKFKYLFTKFLVQNDFPFGARGNGSSVCFFFCDSLSEARVIMWLGIGFPIRRSSVRFLVTPLLNLLRTTFLHAEKDPLEANGILLLQEENNLDFAVKIISSCSKRKILCWQKI